MTNSTIEHYQKALTFAPNSAMPYKRLGRMHLMSGELFKACGYYIQALTCDHNPIPVYGQLRLLIQVTTCCDLDSFNNIYPGLLKTLNQHHENLNNSPELLLLLGEIYQLLGDRDRAYSYLQTAHCKKLASYYPDLLEEAQTSKRTHPPDFIVIGFWKCGTTSFYSYLSQNPKILPALTKELRYFSRFSTQQGYGTPADYFAYFPPINDSNYLTGESTQGYVIQPGLARHLQDWFPKLKIFILLRNPIDRAISNFYMVYSRIHPMYQSILSNIRQLDLDRIDQIIELNQQDRKCYAGFAEYQKEMWKRSTEPTALLARNLGTSQYMRHLPQWFEHFPREQIQIIRSEDLFQNTAATMQKAYNFLEIENHLMPVYKNVNSRRYDPIHPDLRQQLSEYFRPWNQQLEDFLGRSMRWD